MIIKYNTEAIK